MAKTLSCRESPQSLLAPFAVAQIISQMIALLGQALTHPLKDTLPEAIFFQLANGIGYSSECECDVSKWKGFSNEVVQTPVLCYWMCTCGF